MSSKTRDHATDIVRSESRQAVEEAIGVTKGDRTTTWESLVKSEARKRGNWDAASECDGTEKKSKERPRK
jgi:hypothetical protein